MVITHPEKVLFPDDGITKGELAAYYEMIAPVTLPHIVRPQGSERRRFLRRIRHRIPGIPTSGRVFFPQ